MAERFERLFTLPTYLYSEHSPIIIVAGVLLKDTETTKVIVQLKFHSVSITPIRALKVGIAAYDILGNALGEIVEHQYLDLYVHNDQDFGSNKAIILPDSITRSFTINEVTVVLADGKTICAKMPFSTLPQPIPLKSVLKNAELVKQYQLAVNKDAVFVPKCYGDIWCCSCGRWNCEKKCSKCHGEKTLIFKSWNIPVLINDTNTRLSIEKENPSHIPIKENISKSKNVKFINKPHHIIISLIIMLSLFLLLIYPNIIEPLITTNNNIKNDQYYSIDKNLNHKTLVTGWHHTVAIQSDGKVIAAGDNTHNQCNVQNWKNIIALAAGSSHTLGLREDGTVVATGENLHGECDVEGWKDIIAIDADNTISVGLKKDGTVVATGWNAYGQCEVETWHDIIDIAVQMWITIGLKNDGTIVVVGDTENNKLDLSDWKDIVKISTTEGGLIALTSNGKVMIISSSDEQIKEVSQWNDIVGIEFSNFGAIGLKSNGDVIVSGSDDSMIMNDWKYIVSVDTDMFHAVGLKGNGTVAIAGDIEGKEEILTWTDIKLPTNEIILNKQEMKSNINNIVYTESIPSLYDTTNEYIKKMFAENDNKLTFHRQTFKETTKYWKEKLTIYDDLTFSLGYDIYSTTSKFEGGRITGRSVLRDIQLIWDENEACFVSEDSVYKIKIFDNYAEISLTSDIQSSEIPQLMGKYSLKD